MVFMEVILTVLYLLAQIVLSAYYALVLAYFDKSEITSIFGKGVDQRDLLVVETPLVCYTRINSIFDLY